jgi:hypothetical protein
MDAGKIEPGGLRSGAIPGDPTEGGTPRQGGVGVGEADFDAEEEMAALEARRGRQGVGEPVEGVHVGTPAGAGSEVLRNREAVPVRESVEGQSKERTGLNTRRTP